MESSFYGCVSHKKVVVVCAFLKKNTGTPDSSMKIFNLSHADPIFDYQFLNVMKYSHQKATTSQKN